MGREFDIILLGATGYTGRLTASYLQKNAPATTKWAVAGRSAEKLERVKAELGLTVPTIPVAFAGPELEKLCARTTVLLTCAGPFTRIGMPVVEACVRSGTHYVDSTGEFPFVRLVIERFHEEAVAKGLALVPCCGYDCVPSDLGNFVVHREAAEELRVVSVAFRLKSAGISSGTANSIGAVMEQITREDYSPCSLVPKEGPQPAATPTRLGFWRGPTGRASAPYIMASGNERIVRRSNALSGSTAAYVECIEGGLFAMLGVTAAFYLQGLVFAVGPVRRFFLRRFFPADSTSGPSEERKVGAKYAATFVGTTVSGRRVETVYSHEADMYDATAMYLGESALSLVALADAGKVRPGVLTSATAFGDDLVRRVVGKGVNINTTITHPSEVKKIK